MPDSRQPTFTRRLLDQFASGDLANAYDYLDDPEANYPGRAGQSDGHPGGAGRGLAVRALAGRSVRRPITSGANVTYAQARQYQPQRRDERRGRSPAKSFSDAGSALAVGQLPRRLARLHAVGCRGCGYPSWDFRAVFAASTTTRPSHYPRAYPLEPDSGDQTPTRAPARSARARDAICVIHQAASGDRSSCSLTGSDWHRVRRPRRPSRGSPSCGSGEPMIFLVAVRRALRGVRHRLPRERGCPLSDPRGHRGDAHPDQGAPADRRSSSTSPRPSRRARRAAAGAADPRLRRGARPRGQGDLYDLRRRRARHAAARAAGGAQKLHLPVHLEVSDRRPDSVQGVLRFRRPRAGGRRVRGPRATTSTSGRSAPSRRSAGSTTRCSPPRSPATPSSSPPRSFTRSPTTRCT